MMASIDKAARNAAICAAYRAGASTIEVGKIHGLAAEGVRKILKKCGEPTRDRIAAVKANWQDPEFRAKQAAAVKANWQDPEFRAKQAAATKAAASRKLSWCIPELIEDYRLLARHLGAVEARRIIEAQIAEHHADRAAVEAA